MAKQAVIATPTIADATLNMNPSPPRTTRMSQVSVIAETERLSMIIVQTAKFLIPFKKSA